MASLRDYLFLHVQEVIKGRRKPFGLFYLLYPISLVWRFFSFFRNFCYDNGIFFVEKVSDIKVVSIGNIVAGGTGKTPFTLFLAKRLLQKGVPFAISTRGYLSKQESKKPLVLDRDSLFSASTIGDEAALMGKKMKRFLDKQNEEKNFHLIVSKRRNLSLRFALKKGDPVFLLDDGMQYRKIKKDVEIVIIHGKDPLGRGHFLPRGFLRESPKSLKRADFILINHVNNQEEMERIESQLSQYTQAPCIGIRPKPIGFYEAFSLTKVTSLNEDESFQGGFFSSIAHPESFADSLIEMGVKVLGSKIFTDHANLYFEEIETFANEIRKAGGSALFCTEKDGVKLPLNRRFSLPIYVLEMDVEIISGKKHLEMLVAKIGEKGDTIHHLKESL